MSELLQHSSGSCRGHIDPVAVFASQFVRGASEARPATESATASSCELNGVIHRLGEGISDVNQLRLSRISSHTLRFSETQGGQS